MDNKKRFDPNDVGRTFKGKEGIIFTVLKYDPHMEAVHAHNEETGTDWAFPVEKFYQDFEPCMSIRNLEEVVNHPAHYGGDTTYEAIKVIEAWNLNFNQGNAVKYICRADKKGDPITDLEKAIWYLKREIKKLKEAIAPDWDNKKEDLTTRSFQ